MDECYGLAQVDIHVPLELRETFAELPPIFKNEIVRRENLAGHMKRYAEEKGIMNNGWRCLLASYFGKKILMTTDYLRWCLRHGLVVEKCYQFIEFRKSQPFREFVDFVSDSRREGDVNSDLAPRAESAKLVGNSAYGIQIMNKAKFEDTLYVDNKNVYKKLNSPRFKAYDFVNQKLSEVKMFKKKIKHNEPIIVGFTALNNAKQRMLEFKYDFLGALMRPLTCRAIEMDTDSMYIAISETTFEECLTADASIKLNKWKIENCNDDDYMPDADIKFLPRTCCDKHRQFDKRTPGLFKIEWSGTEMVCLNSKTYCAFDSEKDSVKLAMKGSNKGIDNPLEIYKTVLASEMSYEGVNRGFRFHEGQMKTYEQRKNAITYFYCKRIVLEDGVTTLPLDI